MTEILPIDASEVLPAVPEIALPPSALYGEAFHAVAVAEVFKDGIDLADAEWLFSPTETLEHYHALKDQPDFSIVAFAQAHIRPPIRMPVEQLVSPRLGLVKYSEQCILGLVRRPYRTVGSQIGLENETVSPGGRFDTPGEGLGRIYNWDFGPVARGLLRFGSKLIQRAIGLYKGNLSNTRSLIKGLKGNNPNGNSTYFQYRSQPNVYPGAVRRLAEHTEDEDVLLENLEAMEAHHQFWRDGADDPSKLGLAPRSQYRRVSRMPDGEVGHGFYDDGPDNGLGPRDEMYAQDLKEFAAYEVFIGRKATAHERYKFFLNKRAGAEHGEDYSGALYKDGVNPETIHTTDLVSVKLNALMWESARTIAAGYRVKAARALDPAEAQDHLDAAQSYDQEADDLAALIEKYFVVEEPNGDVWLADFDVIAGEQKPAKSLSSVFALARGIIRPELANRMLETMERKFLRTGGFINTLYDTNEQWDKSAWPMMQLEAVDAAMQYGRYDLALKWCNIWLNANRKMYAKYKVLYEKSDPDNPGEPGDGGEYTCVPNLAMTHGVNLEMHALRREIIRIVRQQKVARWVGSLAKPFKFVRRASAAA